MKTNLWMKLITHQGLPLVCFCSRSRFSSLENCRSSSNELLSRSWMYCSMLLQGLSGTFCDELEGTTCRLLNWLRRSSYCGNETNSRWMHSDKTLQDGSQFLFINRKIIRAFFKRHLFTITSTQLVGDV